MSRGAALNTDAEPYVWLVWRAPALVPTVGDVAEETKDEGDYLKRFGVVLKKMRLAAQLTQAEAAERIGTDAQTVSRWENGHNAPRVVELAKMVRLYAPPAETLEYLFNPPPVPRHDLDGLLGTAAAPRRRGRSQQPPAGAPGAPRLSVVPPPPPRGTGRSRRRPKGGRGVTGVSKGASSRGGEGFREDGRRSACHPRWHRFRTSVRVVHELR